MNEIHGFIFALVWFSGTLFGVSQAKYARKKKSAFVISMVLMFIALGLIFFNR
jgi:hypothetical protein